MSAGRSYFKVLLRLLPSSFRASREAELLALFEEMREELGARPGLSRLAVFYARVTLDILERALVERIRALRGVRVSGAGPGQAPLGRLLRRGGPGVGSWLPGVLHDMRIALRGLLKTPAFLLVAVLTMTLAIGANAAVFTILRAVVLRSLPYPEPDRIVMLTENKLSRGWESFRVSPPNYWDWKDRNRSLEAIAAYQEASVSFSPGSEARALHGLRVSEGFLQVMGTSPLLGRGFNAEDLVPESKPVVVLTYALWTRAFGQDPGVLGREVLLEGTKHTVVGVLAKDWEGFTRRGVDLLIPLKPQPYWYTSRGSHMLMGLGRLRPGTSVSQAQTDFSAIASELAAEHPDTNTGWGAVVRPLRDAVLGDSGNQLLLFMLSAAFVLLIACANLANMILSRTLGRSQEFAVRRALGAGRARLSRQLLTETLVLAGLGGALGLLLAHLVVSFTVRTWPQLLPRLADVRLDASVVLFTVGLVFASAILASFVPATNALRTSLQQTIRSGAPGLAGGRTLRAARETLVVAEVALAVILLVGSGLLLRSYRAMESVDPGFVPHGRLFAVTSLAPGKYTTRAEVLSFEEGILAEMHRLPGVTHAAVSNILPLEGGNNIWGFWVEGRPVDPGNSDGSAILYRVSPEYLQTMGVRLLSGRGIEDADRADASRVVVISESLAKEQFPDGEALGRRLLFDPEDPDYSATIVGLVSDVRHDELTETSMPQAYVPFQQFPTLDVGLVLEGSTSTADLARGLQQAMKVVDPDQPLARVVSGDAMVADTIALPRFRTLLMTVFGLTGLLLAVVGLYGVLAYGVSQRRREIGVRMAMGASRASVLILVLRDGLPLLALGLLTGLLGSVALGRALRSMLYAVAPTDPVVLAGVALLLGAVALVAMLVPARGAAATDPARVLGQE